MLRQAFGPSDDPDCRAVNQTIEAALGALHEAGAEVIDPVEVPDLAYYIEYTSLYITHSKHDINQFLAARPGLPTFEEIFEREQFHPALDLIYEIAAGPADPADDPEYYQKYAARERFQRAVVGAMAAAGLDALCCPSVRVVPPTTEELLAGKWTTLTFPTNTLIASQTWMPALTVPAGFTPDGLPVGMELIAKPYDEGSLLRLGYAFEQATKHRRAPASTPPLPD